jgi:hypothetical protein
VRNAVGMLLQGLAGILVVTAIVGAAASGFGAVEVVALVVVVGLLAFAGYKLRTS